MKAEYYICVTLLPRKVTCLKTGRKAGYKNGELVMRKIYAGAKVIKTYHTLKDFKENALPRWQ